MYMKYIVQLCSTLYQTTRAQSVKRYNGTMTSEKSEILTYEDATQVVIYRCVNQQAKKFNSRAVFLLIAVKTNLC